MQKGLFNITGASSGVSLISRNTGRGSLSSIRLTNTSLAVVSVELYLQDEAANKSWLVDTVIPSKVSMVLDNNIKFNNGLFSLMLTNSAGSLGTDNPLSIIIK